MSNNERTGIRDLTYSRAHRPDKLHPLLMSELGLNKARALQLADACTVIDIDWNEYCKWCKKSLALIETTHGTTPKPAGATTELAKDAGKKAFSLAYEADDIGNLTAIAIRQLHPLISDIKRLTPGQWATWLVDLHICHTCDQQPAWLDRAREIPWSPPSDAPSESTGGEAA